MTEITADEALARERLLLRRQMAIQHQVELAMNRLIERMVGLVDQTEIVRSDMEKHQIKNLLSVSLETSSVEVVRHYILYQVGRDVSGKNWRYNDFGHKLTKELEALRQREARQILDQLRKDLPGSGLEQLSEAEQTTLLDEVWLLLARAYLGQLNRYFYYGKEVKAHGQ